MKIHRIYKAYGLFVMGVFMYDGLVLARFNQKFIRVFYKNVDALRYTRHKLLENIFNPRFILTALLWFAKYSPRFTDL